MATKRQLFFKGDKDDQIAESFRVLRTNVHFLDKKDKKTIVVTSTIPKEGKSSVTSNFAMSEAVAGKRVLLIDCDIRRPRAHTSFGIDVERGLADVLTGKHSIEEVIMHNVEENLDLIPSKHLNGNVSEAFLRAGLEAEIEKIRDKYDLILIDTPPLTVATDALMLAEFADGVIYVTAYDMVSKKELKYAKNLMDRAGVNLYGVVINKIDKSGYSYGNYGYYNYTYKYYKEYVNDSK